MFSWIGCLIHVVTISSGQKGVWMFKVGDVINLSPERKCYQWFLQNFALRKEFRTRARSLRNDRCPCLRRWLPWTAIFLPLSPFWWHNPYCVEMRATFELDTYVRNMSSSVVSHNDRHGWVNKCQVNICSTVLSQHVGLMGKECFMPCPRVCHFESTD